MSKVSFTKLGLKTNNSVKTIKFNEQEIEVKQYLPINEKLELITRVLNLTMNDDLSFPNPVQIDLFGTLEIIFAYTNINFTDKQKEAPDKLYDLIDSTGLADAIVEVIPPQEYNFLIDGIEDSINAFYSYKNSALGVMETISKDYSNLDYDATQMQEAIRDPENLDLLKNILTKIG